MTCVCGRRIVRDRAGKVHERCGTCRRQQAVVAGRHLETLSCIAPHCTAILIWDGHGTQPKFCPFHRKWAARERARLRWRRLRGGGNAA